MESRSQYPNLFEAQLISMVCNGVFEKFPDLGIVFLEGGFSWIPAVMWRLDQSWRSLRSEVPWLKKRPSEYIRAQVRFATQPFEEPDDPKQLISLIEMMGSDELLVFSSDYPHWDFDAPANSLPAVLGDELTQKILWSNAAKFYGLPEPAPAPAKDGILTAPPAARK
jgi:predicted TIM-barrel fold metal-dependent hydrolase